MRGLWVMTIVALVWLISMTAAGEVLPDRILNYFPSHWEWSQSDGKSGTVEWKLVSDSTALAGPYDVVRFSGEKLQSTIVLEFPAERTVLARLTIGV